MNPPPYRSAILHAPKDGSGPDEYEDAFAADPDAGRFAVADGASESSFCDLWARQLAEGFVAADPRSNGWLAGLRRDWAGEVDGNELPWYAEEKREVGAYATFLGVSFTPRGEWECLAVGDACLFAVRDGKLLTAFPITTADEFTNRPALISSRGGPADYRVSRGTWRPGDQYLLMTDSVSAWFLRRSADGGQPWRDVRRWLAAESPGEAFAHWLTLARADKLLVNDDVTILSVDFDPKSTSEKPR